MNSFLPFIGLSVIHIALINNNKQMARHITKCCMMPLLCFAYINSAYKVEKLIKITLFFHWIGDICLINNKTFFIGVFSFWIGDILYVKSMNSQITNLYESKLIYIFCFTFPLYLYINLRLKAYLKKSLYVVLYIFLTPLFLMVNLSITIFLENMTQLNFILIIGCISFFYSDFCNIRKRFVGHFNHEIEITMSTYLFAEFCIIYWFCLI